MTGHDAPHDAAAPRPRRIPLLEHLGVEVVGFGGGRAELAFSVRPELCNSMQVVHGGAVMTALDAALSIAGRTAHSDDFDSPVNAITVEMKTTFMRPGTGRLTVKAECVHKAVSLMFCEGEVRDAQGRLVARGCGTFKLWSPRASSAERQTDGRVVPATEPPSLR